MSINEVSSIIVAEEALFLSHLSAATLSCNKIVSSADKRNWHECPLIFLENRHFTNTVVSYLIHFFTVTST